MVIMDETSWFVFKDDFSRTQHSVSRVLLTTSIIYLIQFSTVSVHIIDISFAIFRAFLFTWIRNLKQLIKSKMRLYVWAPQDCPKNTWNVLKGNLKREGNKEHQYFLINFLNVFVLKTVIWTGYQIKQERGYLSMELEKLQKY